MVVVVVRRLTSALVSPAILPFAACSSRCHRRRLACTRSVLYLSVFLRLFSPVCTSKTSRSSSFVVVVVVVQFPPRQPPPPPLLSSSSFSRRGAHPPKLFLLLVLARKRKREKFSPLDASYSSVGVCSFFDERFSIDRVFFSNLSLSTKKNKNEQKKLLGGWNYSFFFFFSHHLCRCFCCFCSPTLPKATLFSADDKDATTKSSSSFLSPFLVFFRE